MTEIEATELKLNCLRLVEGTDINWKQLIRFKDTKRCITREIMEYESDSLEFAIHIIEGRPVFKGDNLWSNKLNRFVVAQPLCIAYLEDCTWNPPKPKTLMVELPIETAREYARYCGGVIAVACQKALNNLGTQKCTQ